MFEKEQVSLSKLQYGRPESVGSEVGESVGICVGIGFWIPFIVVGVSFLLVAHYLRY